MALDSPVNIHLTGCHHSCAQHYIGDIGLLACRVPSERRRGQVEGYHILVGGGFGPDAGIARELYRDVKAEDCPRVDRAHAQGVSRAPRRPTRRSSPSPAGTRSSRSRRLVESVGAEAAE